MRATMRQESVLVGGGETWTAKQADDGAITIHGHDGEEYGRFHDGLEVALHLCMAVYDGIRLREKLRNREAQD